VTLEATHSTFERFLCSCFLRGFAGVYLGGSAVGVSLVAIMGGSWGAGKAPWEPTDSPQVQHL